MLEKPDIQDERIVTCLQTEFGLGVTQIQFLPLGYDLDTAVYRAAAQDGSLYFVKLRRGKLDGASIEIPRYLFSLGLKQAIPPYESLREKLWADLEPYHLVLYPWIDGQNGYEARIEAHHWVELGHVLRWFHAVKFPDEITGEICRERFSTTWRDMLKILLERVGAGTFREPIAAETAALMFDKKDVTLDLVYRAEKLAEKLKADPPDFILCHGDLHVGNLLVDREGSLYLVDWDTLVFAPKERDLMVAGSGLGGSWFSPQQEEAYFYRGYGDTEINHIALAYYRYARIIEDIAIFCQQLAFSDEGGDDRPQSLHYLKSNFEPGGTIEIALRSCSNIGNIYP